MDTAYLALKNIKHNLKDFELKIEGLSFSSGDRVAILGRNGAGKSTLSRILAFLERPQQGRIFFKGKEVSTPFEAETARKKVSYLVQKPVTFSGTVKNSIDMVASIRKASRSDVDEVIDAFELSPLLRKSASELSTGEARRLQVALAFIGSPEAVVLDEATSFLDEEKRMSLMEMILNISERVQNLFFVTHRFDEAVRLARNLVILEKGAVAFSGNFSLLSETGWENLLDPFRGLSVVSGKAIEVSGSLVKLKAGDTFISGHSEDRLKPGDACKAVISGDTVVLSPEKDGLSTQNVIEVEVKSVSNFKEGSNFFRVFFAKPFAFSAVVTADSIRALKIEPGRKICAAFKASSVKIYRSV